MFRPRVPISSYAHAAKEMARIARESSLSGKPSPGLRWVKDARGDQEWQSPEETERRGAGSCDDLVIRWARYLAPAHDVRIVLGRAPGTGRTIHVWLLVDGARFDPSPPAGMPNPHGDRLYEKVLAMAVMSPEMFDEFATGEEVTAGTEAGPLSRFFARTDDPTWAAALSGLYQAGADKTCAESVIRGLRAALGWESHDPELAKADPGELAKLTLSLPGWEGLRAECIEGARAAIDLVRAAGANALTEYAAVLEAEPATPALCLMRAALTADALGLLDQTERTAGAEELEGEPALPWEEEEEAEEVEMTAGHEGHEHGDEPCPDPEHCDCEPCSLAKAEQTAGAEELEGEPALPWEEEAEEVEMTAGAEETEEETAGAEDDLSWIDGGDDGGETALGAQALARSVAKSACRTGACPY